MNKEHFFELRGAALGACNGDERVLIRRITIRKTLEFIRELQSAHNNAMIEIDKLMLSLEKTLPPRKCKDSGIATRL